MELFDVLLSREAVLLVLDTSCPSGIRVLPSHRLRPGGGRKGVH